MTESAVIDLAAFVWDKDDFNEDKYAYWQLISHKIKLLDELKKNKLKLLCRNQLRDNIWAEFPYNNAPISTKDMSNRITIFLTTSKFEEYPSKIKKELVSIPNQIRLHFSETIQKENSYLLSDMYTSDTTYFYFTFKKIWNGISKLILKKNDDEKDISVIVIKEEQDIIFFFNSYKPIFEHNPKHDRIKSGDYESSLSCFNGIDNTIPQKLLDTAIEYKGVYYNFDSNNDVWVVFRNHLNNLYHGYDEINEQKIPIKIRKKLRRP